MKKCIQTVFVAGMMLTGFFNISPSYAQETDAYKVSYNNVDDVTHVLNTLYSSKIGTMKYTKTETRRNGTQVDKIMTYESDDYQIEITGLNINQSGKQDVTLKLSNKTNRHTASARVSRSALKDSTIVLDRGMVVEDKTTIDVTAANDSQQNIETATEKEDAFYQNIADAALAQVGEEQDCTMLVTNSLASVGIHFHGWPEEYLSLGTVTDHPVPGDIVVYSGHVAIYVGDGQAVHGGWDGHTTVQTTVECNNQLIGYVHVNH